MWPTPDHYDEAVQNLHHSMGDEELRRGQAALDEPATADALGGQFRPRLQDPLPGDGQHLGPEVLHAK